MTTQEAILITGASSGIGRALALALARDGRTLILMARDEARLADTARLCEASGASVHSVTADVCARAAMADALLAADHATPIGLVIANAGITSGTPRPGEVEAEEDARRLLEVNLTGALNTVLPLIAPMRARRKGQIVLISSIAAFTPLPDAPAYSASKAALLAYGLALRQKLRGDGIRVNVVCPGYVTTPMSQSYRGWKPLEIAPDRAARRILDGIARDRAVIAFPWLLAKAARLQGLLPDAVNRYAMKAFGFTIEKNE